MYMANNAISNTTTTTTTTTETSIHIVMFPFLAFGHISPFVQLARKLINTGSARVTFLSAAGNVPRVTSLLPSSSSISIIPLHLPPVPDLPAGAESTAEVPPGCGELLMIALDGTKPQVGALLTKLCPNVVIFDISTPWIPSLASPLGIKSMLFSVFAAVSIAYVIVPARRLHGPDLKIDDLKLAPAGFPASSPLRYIPLYQAADLLYVYKSFHGRSSVYNRLVRCIESCDAVIMKTCKEMESHYLDYFASQFQKEVFLVGPNVPDPPQGELEPKWAQWLANFDVGTVILASFGSETFLTQEAAQELLLGLEMSGLPFLVVLNFPKSDSNVGELDQVKKRYMPLGFEDRVKGRGVVHSGWVQQQHLLRHPAVGCYINHAGISSLIEALVADCRLVLMPQKGDQFLNSALFAKELGIGVEVERAEEDGRFTREAVCNAVKMAMEGDIGAQQRKKWREFLMDELLQQRFTSEFVKNLKEFVVDS